MRMASAGSKCAAACRKETRDPRSHGGCPRRTACASATEITVGVQTERHQCRWCAQETRKCIRLCKRHRHPDSLQADGRAQSACRMATNMLLSVPPAYRSSFGCSARGISTTMYNATLARKRGRYACAAGRGSERECKPRRATLHREARACARREARAKLSTKSCSARSRAQQR